MIAVRERGVSCKIDFAVIVNMITPVSPAGATRVDTIYAVIAGVVADHEIGLLDSRCGDGIMCLTLIATLTRELLHD